MESTWTAVETRTQRDARDGTDRQRAPERVVVVGQSEEYILFERARDEPRLLRAQRHPPSQLDAAGWQLAALYEGFQVFAEWKPQMT